jgi:hypothetical protein
MVAHLRAATSALETHTIEVSNAVKAHLIDDEQVPGDA